MNSKKRNALLVSCIGLLGAGVPAFASDQVPNAQDLDMHGVKMHESLSTIVFRWREWMISLGNLEPSSRIYGKHGLLQQTLLLNPEIRSPDRIYPGMKIRFPAVKGMESTVLTPSEVPEKKPPPPAPIEPEPISVPATPPPPPSHWSWTSNFKTGALRSSASETVSGYNSETGNRVTFQAAELSVAGRKSSPDGLSPWEYFGSASFQINQGVGSLPFPASYGYAAGINHKGRVDLGGSIQREEILQGTPDRTQTSSGSKAFFLRKTQVFWGMANLQIPFHIGGAPLYFQLGAGHSIAASSSTDSKAGALSSLSGWKYRTGLGLQIGTLFGLPLGVEGQFETEKLTQDSQNSISQSVLAGLLKFDLF